MQSGRLRYPIEIESVQKVERDSLGGERTKTRIISTRADIRHDRGSRIDDNGEIFHPYDITFIVWLYIKDHIDDYDTVIWEGRRYRIVTLEPVRETQILYIKCTLENE